MLYRLLHPIVNRLMRLLAHVEVQGVEKMPRGGVLLISNHLTNFDVLVVGMSFKRELHFMAKTELYQVPIMGWLIPRMNGFPVRRGEADRAALRQAEELLNNGRVVAIFPEGHRSRDGGVQESRGGVALLARRTHKPILPVAVTGTEQLRLPAALKWRPWRRPTITLTVGDPFVLPQPVGRADYNALANVIMSRVAELLPPAYRGVFNERTEDT
jgi:1-acyl-sn-glycerol-3-phosphate acyltransferase